MPRDVKLVMTEKNGNWVVDFVDGGPSSLQVTACAAPTASTPPHSIDSLKVNAPVTSSNINATKTRPGNASFVFNT